VSNDWPCSVCNTIPSAEVRERLPGSKGHNRNSFRSSYRLCARCLKVCSESGAIEDNRPPDEKKNRDRLFTVRGKTYAWLCNLRDNVWAKP
jgi:hypothetical protein